MRGTNNNPDDEQVSKGTASSGSRKDGSHETSGPPQATAEGHSSPLQLRAVSDRLGSKPVKWLAFNSSLERRLNRSRQMRMVGRRTAR